MTDLSPAAQAVLDAWEAKLDPMVTCLTHDPEREALAAALRAAADQLQERKPRLSIGIDWSSNELYVIAAELEAIDEEDDFVITAELGAP